MYLLDSTALIELIKGTKTGKELVEQTQAQQLGVSAITVFEILVGSRESEKEKIGNRLLTTSILPLDDEIAQISAELSRTLSKRGLAMDKLDLFIAATALKHDVMLITLDKVFQRIPNLRVTMVKA